MLALALIACGGNPQGTFVTWNAGLAEGFVPGANERLDAVAAAVGSLDADVVCLQEVWSPEQIAAVQAAAANNLPHQHFPAAQQQIDDAPACPDGELDALTTCALERCTDVCDDELVGCIQGSCPIQFLSLADTCLGCAMANVGTTVEAVEDACATQTTHYAYGGSFGIGLLSAHPLEDVEEHVFSSTTNRRAALHAVVKLPGGLVDVYCTHLTAAFDLIPYPREEGSWSQEQTTQIEELRAWIDETATHPVVAMGDFNAGPAGEGITAEEPVNYANLVAGFDSPYLAADGRCTFCGDNPLIALGNDDSESETIDHVLFRGFDAPVYSVERVLDGDLEHPVCDAPITGALSDHYGVRVSVGY